MIIRVVIPSRPFLVPSVPSIPPSSHPAPSPPFFVPFLVLFLHLPSFHVPFYLFSLRSSCIPIYLCHFLIQYTLLTPFPSLTFHPPSRPLPSLSRPWLSLFPPSHPVLSILAPSSCSSPSPPFPIPSLSPHPPSPPLPSLLSSLSVYPSSPRPLLPISSLPPAPIPVYSLFCLFLIPVNFSFLSIPYSVHSSSPRPISSHPRPAPCPVPPSAT